MSGKTHSKIDLGPGTSRLTNIIHERSNPGEKQQPGSFGSEAKTSDNLGFAAITAPRTGFASLDIGTGALSNPGNSHTGPQAMAIGGSSYARGNFETGAIPATGLANGSSDNGSRFAAASDTITPSRVFSSGSASAVNRVGADAAPFSPSMSRAGAVTTAPSLSGSAQSGTAQSGAAGGISTPPAQVDPNGADAPTLAVAPAFGLEDHPIGLVISAQLTDTSETLSVVIAGVPVGAILSAGTHNPDGTWTLAPGQLTGLTITPPLDFKGTIGLTVTAISRDGTDSASVSAGLTVTVTPVADLPSLLTLPAVGLEDLPIPLVIVAGLLDLSETLSVTISGVPTGATLSAGVNNGDGTWTLAQGQLIGLTLTAPHNFNGSIGLTVTATSADGSDTASTSSGLTVTVIAVPDLPNLATLPAIGLEDLPIPLVIVAGLADLSETLSITISGVPTGAMLSAGIDNGDGTWTLTQGQLLGLTLTAPRDFHGSIGLTVTATSADGSGAANASAPLPVTVISVPDLPTLATLPAVGLEDLPIPLVIVAGLSDLSETLSITISGIPTGAALSAGTDNGNGTWTLTQGQLLGLLLTPPHDFNGSINLSVTATSADGSGSISTSSPLSVTVIGVPDLPTLSALPAVGLEDLPIPLVIVAGLSDLSETLSITISGVPTGATLSAGINNGNGTWTLTQGQLVGLTFTAPHDFKGSIGLTVTATSADGSDSINTSIALGVTVIGVPDLPNLAALPAVGLEDLPIPLVIVAGLADLTETLSITISDVPAGAALSAGTNNGNGTWTLTQTQLVGLTFTAPHDFKGNISLTVTATSADGSDTASTSTSLGVTVIGVPDLPTLSALPAAGLEDLPIPLVIVAGLSDLSETLSITISGIPTGAALSAGTNNGDGTWTLTQGQLLGLTLTPPHDFKGSIGLTVTAISADGSDTTSASAALNVTVIGVPDLPNLATLPAVGLEDLPIPLAIVAGLADLTETLSITIAGVPAGATLSAGINNGNGTWTLSQGQLLGLTLTPPHDFKGSIGLNVTATSADGSNTISTSAPLAVTVIGVPDLPNLATLPALGLEDLPIPLAIVAGLADITETLSITIAGVPAGATLSAGINNGNGIWTLSQAQLLGLTLTAPQDFKGNIQLTVTATSADGADTASTSATLNVTVVGVPDLPNLAALPAVGLEDLPIPLIIVAGLADLAETLSITISGVPAGAMLSAGTNNGDGTWTLSQTQLLGLTLTPPQDFKGQIGLNVTATSADGSSTTSTSAALSVTIIGVPDLPNLATLPAVGLEDLPIPLAIVAGLADITETLSITIGGVPAGATLSAGTNNGNSTWTLSQAQLVGLTLTAPQDFKGAISLTVTATSTDGSNSISNSATLAVTVIGVPDLPNLATLPAIGLEDLPIPLAIVAGLADLTETLSITISGVPAGAALSAGTNNGNGTWTLSQAQLIGLTLTPPQDFKGNLNLTVTATSADGSDTTSTSATLNVSVIGVPDLPNLATLPAIGLEDLPIPLGIIAGLADPTETLSITISGVPAGATLSAGTNNGDGTWTLAQGQLPGLTLTPPQDFNGTISLTVTAVSTDGGTSASTSAGIQVTVIGVPDLPTLATLPAIGLEDLPIPLAIVAGLNDPSETLSITISGVPAGAVLSAGTRNSDGSWTLTQGQLTGLMLTPPQDFHGTINLTVTATASDGHTTAQSSAGLTVSVASVPDLPSLITLPALGLEDMPIALAITAFSTDPTETLSITIAGVPAGASLSAGHDNGNGTWTLTQGQLGGLTLTPPQDFKGSLSLTVTATSTDNGQNVSSSAGLQVVVTGMPDLPTLLTLPAVGLEDQPILLAIAAGLTDPGETLSITIGGVPTGASLSAGHNNGDGTWTLTSAQLPGLALTPPNNFHGSFNLTVTATSTDGGQSVSTSAALGVSVAGLPDLPTLTALPAAGLEDLPIALVVTAGLTDHSETLSITISGVPADASLSAGQNNGNGSWTLTPFQLLGLTLTPPHDYKGTLALSVSATSSDGTASETATTPLYVTVVGVPDLPTLTALPAVGLEDVPVALIISAGLTDPTETLSLMIAGVPTGASLSAGHDNGDGTWTLTPTQLIGLTLTPPRDFHGQFSLNVIATTTDGSHSISTSTPLGVSIASVPDLPTLLTLPAIGLEDQPIALQVTADLVDLSETLTITISGVPSGALLSAGVNNGNGTWTVTPGQIAGLSLTPPHDFKGNFALTVTATASDGTNSVSLQASLGVTVIGVPDLPNLVTLPALGLEDLPVALVITAGLTDPDDTLSVVISGMPNDAALSAGIRNADGSWTLTPAQLTGLLLTPPHDFKGVIGLTVTANSTDGSTTTSTASHLSVTVIGVADAPVLAVLPAVGLPNAPVALVITALPVDVTEQLSITIGGVPTGASLSAGTNNGDGTWTLTPLQIVGLTLNPPHNFQGNITLNVVATSHDGTDSASTSASLGVTVGLNLNAPSLSVATATGVEDHTIALSINAALTNLSETLGLTITGVPGSATLSAGTKNPDGSWTLTKAQLTGLTLSPPANFSGTVLLTVTATSTGILGTSTSVSALSVNVTPEADAPLLTVAPAAGLEDHPIALAIQSSVTDPSEVLTLTIAGVPAGATLSAGIRNANGTWSLTSAQLSGLTITPPTNFKGSLNLTITATSTDGPYSATTSSTLAVTVGAVADTPTLSTLPAAGLEDQPIALAISSALTDSSETLSVTISGIPAGAALSAGVNNGNGTWTLTPAQLVGLTLTPPANFKGAINLTVTATSTDGSDHANATAPLVVTVSSVADTPSLSLQPAHGLENQPIALGVTAAPADAGETLSVTISGVPAGAMLSAGNNNGNGSWTLTSAQLAGLTLTPPANYKGTLNLTVTATATDGADSASNSDTLAVSVSAVADTPLLSVAPATGLEDQPVALAIAAALNDPSETLSITISGVPTGASLSAGVNNGNGSWTLTPGQLAGLTLTPAPDFKGTLQLTVAARSTDGADYSSVTAVLAVTVTPQADTPVLMVSPAIGLEDHSIALTLSASLADPGETLAVTLSGIPAGATLSAGHDNGDGSWTLTAAQLAGLTLTPPANFKGTLHLMVTATSTDVGSTTSTSMPLDVSVSGVADLPTLSVVPAHASEGQPIALAIAAGLSDASETLSITVAGVPSGATLSAGTNNGNGIWTLTPAQLAGLTLVPASNFKGSINLTVTATSADGADSASMSLPLNVTVDAVASVPQLAVSPAVGLEDQPVALSISASVTDPTETLTIILAGMPAGAVLSAGNNNGDGTWTLTAAQLAGLTLTPPTDFKGQINLSVTAVSSDGTQHADASASLGVTVTGTADAPLLAVAPVSGQEDQPVALVISAAPQDTSETLSIHISGVPAGGALSAGIRNPDGSWTLTPAQLTGLTLTPPADFKGTLSLVVTAVSTDDTDQAQTSAGLNVTFTGVADTPTLVTAPAAGLEDTPIALSIAAGLTDASETLSVVVAGIPTGAALSRGHDNGDGTWTVGPADLAGLSFIPPQHFKGVISLVVTALSADGAEHAQTSAGLQVVIGAVADTPFLTVAPSTGHEDSPIALAISAGLVDPSEALTITISGVPTGAHLSAGIDNGDGSWQVLTAELAGLTLTPPQDFKGALSLTVTATSTDGASSTSISSPLSINVSGSADTPNLSVVPAIALEGQPIPLDITAGLTDPTETLGITISGLPVGATLSAGTQNPDGSWSLTPAQLAGLVLTPPAFFNGTLQLNVTATSTDGADQTSISQPLAISIGEVADAPLLSAAPAAGLEGQPILLNIAASLTDPSETLSITLSGVPAGATLSAGTRNPDGSWNVAPSALAGLSLTLDPHFRGTLALTVTATSSDGSGSSSTSAVLPLMIDATASTPTLAVSPAIGLEDQAINLSIAASSNDPSETVSVMLSGVPAGAHLSTGTNNGDGTWTLSPAQLAGLALLPPSNFKGLINLIVTATSTDGSEHASRAAPLAIMVGAVADAPNISVGNTDGQEDHTIALSLSATLVDPTETLSVMIIGVPAGAALSAGTRNADGSWTVAPGDLAGLQLTPPANFKGSLTLTLTAVSTDGTEHATSSATFNVDINAVADAPVLSVNSATGLEDHAIPLVIAAALTDASEVLSLSIDGVPAGATLSAGTRNADGSWTLTPAQLTGLTLTPATHFKGTIGLTVTATSTDGTEHTSVSAGLNVTVNAVANAPTLATLPALGLEDQPIALGITAGLTDASETLGVTITGVPTGATLSAGTHNANGSWTLTPAQLTGLTLTPAANFKGSIALTVTATSTDGAQQASVSTGLNVTVAAVADTPTLATLPALGLEDQPIALGITAGLTDASEALGVTITGVPTGATLSAGTRNANGSWTLTPAQLTGLTLTPAANFKGSISLTVTATSTDGSQSASISSGLNVTVTAVADTPTLATLPAVGLEGQAVSLAITAGLTDISETLGVTITGVPNGATLSAGTHNADGSWSLTSAQLTGLKLTPPAHFKGTIGLTVTATSTDGSQQTSVSSGLAVTITPVADTPTLATLPALGLEGHPITLGITAGLTDASETLAVSITGVPTGATLSAGTRNADGSWSLTPAQLTGLSITPPAHFKGTIGLTVTATSTDGSQQTSISSGLAVTVTPFADTPTLTTLPAVGLEGQPISLDISAGLTDASETLGVKITGVPSTATLSAGTHNADGSWSLTPAQLTGLKLTPSADFKGSIALVVTATSSDGSQQASISTGLNVSVAAVADTPTLSLGAVTGREGGSISLNITAASTDTSGSEVVTVLISGVPRGSVMSAGTYAGNNTWSLSKEQLAGLTITPPATFSGNLNLSVTATSREDNGSHTSLSSNYVIPVAPVADAPVLTVGTVRGLEDTAISLDIGLAVKGNDASETLGLVTIAGVPTGATLSAGTQTGANTWTVTAAQLAGLKLTPPLNDSSDFTLTVTARSVESDGSIATTTGSLPVIVAGVADTPTSVTAGTVTGALGAVLPLSISAAATTDSSETLTYLVSGIPDGFALSRGTNNGNNSWTLQPADLASVSLVSPPTFNGQLKLYVTAVSHETDGTGTATGTPASFLARVGNYASGLQVDLGVGVQLGGIGIGVQVTAGVDLDLLPASGGLLATNGVYMREDSTYLLNDAPSLLGLPVLNGLTALISRVVLSGLPTDATLSAGVNKGGGVWELTQAQLTGLRLTTGPNNDTNFTIVSSVRLISTVVVHLTSTSVNVMGIADTPTLSVGSVTGTEDGTIPLTITGGLGDTDGSETLSYLVSGLPSGFTLSAGTNNGNGTWSLTAGQITGLTVTPAHNYSGTVAITVSAIATEQDGDQTVVQQTVNLNVTAAADAPTIGASLISGVEGSAIALNFNVSLSDTDGSESISGLVISGLPAGATLTNATHLGNGSWSVDAAHINSVSLVPPASFSGDFNLSVTAISKEASNASTAQTTTSVPVHIEATATVPSLTVSDSSGYSDSTIPLTIGAHLMDTDGSEHLSIIISGVPADAHLSAGTFNPDGSWTLTSNQLTGLTMTPGSTLGHFNLSVTAISQEQSNGMDASITHSLGITVEEAPQLMSLSFSDSAFMMALDSLQDPINAFGALSSGGDLMSPDYHFAAAASLDALQTDYPGADYGQHSGTPATHETQQSDVPVVDPALALLPDIQHKGFH